MHALVIEGGSVRAAYVNGVLAAWEEAGWDPFDAVYGTSAGGALAAWWAAGQAGRAVETWSYVGDHRILSWSRWLLRRGPLLDHDALFRIVYEEEHPLDVEAVRQAPHPVVVPVTDAETGETRYRDVRDGPVLAWLRAAGRMPLGCGPPVEVGGRRWLTAGRSLVNVAWPLSEGTARSQGEGDPGAGRRAAGDAALSSSAATPKGPATTTPPAASRSVDDASGIAFLALLAGALEPA